MTSFIAKPLIHGGGGKDGFGKELVTEKLRRMEKRL
jgi:hypothetical protein